MSSPTSSAKPAASAVPTVRPDFNWDKKPAGMMGYRS
jgi:hypothetical protein